ncbi:helix-turn-helix transcriptional regulator [Olsenella profusa]|uniref:DNA-binding helix-turn-helix protein n=1 Tax=Olsenella profusa F0195 TaxID=1125712 RepID=U2T140_9ACTN|nr:helix-turn-helix transcriptional regulator [Olsenella profusa]ERL06749.1 DNA-binding helix-turn-helix protein [Olsenella profusa F0195]
MSLQLKRIRKERGLTQRVMAEKLNVDWRTYGAWERGAHSISLAQAYECAEVLGCSIDEIAGHNTKKIYEDPYQAELNRCWNAMGERRKAALLVTARDAVMAERGDAQRNSLGEGVA